ncbi:MAG TPA: phage head-tail connector protein [Jiangellaceae bacterium]
MTEYTAGETATLLAQFAAYPGGPAADVTGLTVTISPTGGGAAVVGPTSSGVVHESTGLYSYPWAIDVEQAAGTYVVEWNADGGVTASEAVTVLAGPTGWEPDYVTVAELRAHLRIGDSDDDAALAVAITAASRAIDTHTNRQFGRVTEAEERRFTARADTTRGRWVVPIDDLMSTTSLAVEVDGDALTDYELEPVNAASKSRPWSRLVVSDDSSVMPAGDRNEVAVTALWGWTAVPTAVKQACLLQAARFHARRDSPYGIAGSPDQGNELRLLARVDPDVAVALRTYVKPRAVG